MSDLAAVEWSKHPEEYACQSCGSSAQGYSVHKREIIGKPEEIRLSMKDSLFPWEVYEWDDGKGCDVIDSPEVNTPRRSNGSYRNGPMHVLCDSCHNAPSLSDQRSRIDFYWRISTRHGEIWAHNRQHLVAIRDYIQLDRRPQGFYKLPGWILASKNRDEMVKLINNTIENGPSKS